MPIQTLLREGRKIIYTDFRDCKSEAEMERLFEKAAQMVLAEPEQVLTMNNFEGVDISATFMKKLRTRGADYKHKVKAKAVLGVTGIKKTLINTYSVLSGIEARAFSTEEEALRYLLSRS